MPWRCFAQFIFAEVGAARGIQSYAMPGGMGAGIAAADYDDDGDIDVFVPNEQNVPDQLYRNMGSGQFEEIAAEVGLASLAGNRAALWFDYDGDQDLDLLVVCDESSGCLDSAMLHLYRQLPNGTFEDVTVQAGLTINLPVDDTVHVGGICAGDINKDTYLDFYVCFWEGSGFLFLNNTQGGFDDISDSAGVGSNNTYWQPMMHDFDGDGWLDIFQAVDFDVNILWMNQRDNTFIDMAPQAGVDNAFNEMGMTFGDYDNDGDIDVYITNVTQNDRHNVLFRNDSVGTSLSFSEVSQAAGVDEGYWGWGTTFLDANNDGWLDIAETNASGGSGEPSKFYLNPGGAPFSFTDVSTTVQFDDTEEGFSLIAFDYDRDGDLDMMQSCEGGPLRLLENQPAATRGSNNHLVVRPRISGANHRAIGALVRVTVGSTTMTRLITAGTSFLSQEPAEAFFGIGSATTVDTLVIEWPDGSQTTLFGVAGNQVLTFTHGGFGDVNASGSVDLVDFATFALCFGKNAPDAVCEQTAFDPSDMNNDGLVNLVDFATFALHFGV